MTSFLLAYHHWLMTVGALIVIVPGVVSLASAAALLHLLRHDRDTNQHVREVYSAMQIEALCRVESAKPRLVA